MREKRRKRERNGKKSRGKRGSREVEKGELFKPRRWRGALEGECQQRGKEDGREEALMRRTE